MQELIGEIIISYGLIAIMLLMVSNGFFSAPPSELILALGGIWATANNVKIIHVIIAGSLGNAIGAIVLYCIGLYFGVEWLLNMKNKLESSGNKIFTNIANILPSRDRLRVYEQFFNENALLWVGALRCFPVVRSIVSLPAGAMKMNFYIFLSISSIGICIWATFWVSVGFVLNKAWIEIQGPAFFVFSFMFCTLLVIIYRKYRIYSLSIIDKMTEPRT